jgi:hypothetical protein
MRESAEADELTSRAWASASLRRARSALEPALLLARPSFSKEEWHYVLPGIAYAPPCQ